ncbi:MAG: class II aldolase/adducin family protein [Candidatus Margulisiibacteriota bacterium]
MQPKFKVVFLGDNFPPDPRMEELKYWCNEFSRVGLMPRYAGGAFGNLSFRFNRGHGEFIITASGMKDTAKDDSFVMVTSIDFEQEIVYCHGLRAPSSESMLHYLIYQQRKDINAVFHGHCQKLLDCADKLKLPCTPKEEPYGTLALAQGVLKVLDNHQLVIMKNHGFIAVGKDMAEAGSVALQARAT